MEHFVLMHIEGDYIVGAHDDFLGTMMYFDNLEDALLTIQVWNAFINGKG